MFASSPWLLRLSDRDPSLNADDLAFLESEDIPLLNLPTLAQDVVVTCMKLEMCTPPLQFDFASLLENPRLPIQV